MGKGLSHRFSLKNGRFVLTEGSTKVKDNYHFFMTFDTVSRIYYSDFQPKLLWLIQKPSSTVNTLKGIILGRMKKVLLKYIIDAQIRSIELQQFRAGGEKGIEIKIDYIYTGKDNVEDSTTIFV